MLKNEAMHALYLIQNKLRLPQLPGDPVLINIFSRLQQLIDAKSKLDDLQDLISDYKQTLEIGKYPEYAEETLKKIFERNDKRY